MRMPSSPATRHNPSWRKGAAIRGEIFVAVTRWESFTRDRGGLGNVDYGWRNIAISLI